MLLPASKPADDNSVDLPNSMRQEVSATDRTEHPTPATRLDRGSFRRLARCGGAPIGMLFALALAGCDGKAQSQAAAPPPPPVTVAQPVKRTVTDWDEFTGRFEAIEEVEVNGRVAALSPMSSSRTATWCMPATYSTSSTLVPSRQWRPKPTVSLPMPRQTELAKRELDRGLTLVQTSAVSEQVVDQRRQALQAAPRRRNHCRRRAEGSPAQRRIHARGGADHRTRQPSSRQRRQSRAAAATMADRRCLRPSSPWIRSTSISTWTSRPT